ncbi:MAG: hypothetical protein E6K98_06125 [Thaumarchaeota archaeon]|nr:MAG: hypothetical protein E6K98_06125 [Nitrososphaerota archaeon]TLX94455.1 MAG: hypothetical protein E6K91_06085 [Nitrososphaerota archaeon]
MYAYGLETNPYPSSPTPTEKDAKILGGKRHKEAKSAILECIKELNCKVHGREAATGDFRVITVIQDVGSGKTHLALHIKNLQGRHNIACSFVDLSTISPKTMSSIYNAILKGLENEFFVQLRSKFLEYLGERAENGDGSAKKALDYSFVNKITGLTIKDKVADIVRGKEQVSVENLKVFLIQRFNHFEATFIKSVVTNSFESIGNLEELIGMMSSISKLTQRFLGKIVLFEMDEFDGNKESIEFVKGIINAHIPASVLLLVSTPSGYLEVQNSNPSVFDRLEKANYKIDLVGSNSKEELSEIAVEYIKHNDKNDKFGSKEQEELYNKIQVLCDEFPEFRNVRSLINILYHTMEKSEELELEKIDENAIDDAIRQTYPGLRVRGSIMDIPISDFISIRRSCDDDSTERELKKAVDNLTNFAQEMGNICKLEKQSLPLDAVYQDSFGSKVGIAVVANKNDSSNLVEISNISKSVVVDKLVILTNKKIPSPYNATVVNIDKSKMIDLFYFNSKYTGKKIAEEDNERAEILARTLSII